MAGLKVRESARTRREHKALHSGLGRSGSQALAAIVADADDLPSDRIILAWRLAQYHAVSGNAGAALDMLDKMYLLSEQFSAVLPLNWRTPGSALEIDLALKTGNSARAKSVLAQLRETSMHVVDQELFSSNIALAEGVHDDSRLEGLNRYLATQNIRALSLQDRSKPLSLGNVMAQAASSLDEGLPKVSIIVPAYNCADTISIALDGLLAQTWRNIEVIVVDDASPDGVGGLIAAYAARDKRVIPFKHNENRGAYAARNSGLSVATGDYVTVNDADDWAHPQRIEIQMKALLASGGAANYSDAVRCRADLDFQLRPTAGTFAFKNMSSVIYRRETIVDLSGWHVSRVAADSELIARHELKFGPMAGVLSSVPLSLVLASETSLTRNGPTSIASLNYGARREYKSAYLHWHGQQMLPSYLESSLEMTAQPFPIPAICKPGSFDVHQFDALHIGCSARPDAGDLVWAWHGKSHQGFFDWPVADFMRNGRDGAIQQAINAGHVQPVVWGETVTCDTLIVHHELPAIPDELPAIVARQCIVLVDDAATVENLKSALGLNPIVDVTYLAVSAFDATAPVPTRRAAAKASSRLTSLKAKIQQLEQKRLALR